MGTEENCEKSVMMVGVPVEIQTEHILNVSMKRYSSKELDGFIVTQGPEE
jgi:hypothetical protein